MGTLRVATFNLENLGLDNLPIRLPIIRRQIKRLNADVLCFQEVHADDREFEAFDQVLDGLGYPNRIFTVAKGKAGEQGLPYLFRNLVTVCRAEFKLSKEGQYCNDLISPLEYKKITAQPPEETAKEIMWERPILHGRITDENGLHLDIVNVHFKSQAPTDIKGQKDGFKWLSARGWAEGFFVSALKRLGQALETRTLLDQIFAERENPCIIVCGDYNAEPGEVTVETICGKVEYTENPALYDHQMVSCAKSIPEGKRYTLFFNGRPNLIDHILISPNLLMNLKFADIHNETLADETIRFRSDDKFPESDHAPFFCEFEFP